jgi:NarL family two-component system response regulator LiaR
MSPQTPIRVFIVDDHPMVRRGLASLIGEAGFLCVGEAGGGDEALRVLPAAAPDVALIDLVMPRVDGVAVIAALAPRMATTRFVVLTSAIDTTQIRRAMDAGACGYLLKTAGSQELVSSIVAAHGGRRVLAPEAADAMLAASQRRTPGHDLTDRERELLGLMAQGFSNQEIATALSIAVPTVKYHVTNILTKLHANNRTEAVLTALKFKLVEKD